MKIAYVELTGRKRENDDIPMRNQQVGKYSFLHMQYSPIKLHLWPWAPDGEPEMG